MNRSNELKPAVPGRGYLSAAMILVVIQVALFVISIPGYKIGVDEAWFGEQAYYMATDGYVHSELFNGFGAYGQQLFVYHKLFIWLGSLLVALFGFSLTVLRSLSIASVLVLLGLVWLHDRWYSRGGLSSTVITSLILFSCPLFFSRINNYRPEILLTALGLACFLLLVRYLGKADRRWLIGAGIVAGACLLVHLNGLIYVGAGGVLLLSRKKPIDTLLFGLIAALIVLIYFADAHGQIGVVLQQFAYEPSHPSANFDWYQPVLNLLAEHKRLFRSPEIIGLSVLFGLALIRRWFDRCKHDRDLLIFTISLVIILGMSGHHKTTKYAILLFPFMAMVVSSVLRQWQSCRHRSAWLKYPLVGWLGLYVAVGLIMNTQTALAKKEYIEERTQSVADHLPPGERIMAPMKFIFNQIDRFDIRGYEGTSMILNRQGQRFTPSVIHRYAREQKITHLLIDLDHPWDKDQKLRQMPHEQFEVVDTIAGFLILRVTL